MTRWLSLIGFVVVCLLVGYGGSLFTQASLTTWYAQLQRPPLTPPDRVFGPVWTALYILMAIAGWRIWNLGSPKRKPLMALFFAQLFLNGVWSYLFFGLQNPRIALVDIVLLWLCLFILVQKSLRAERPAGFLLVPYILWVSFATYLNAAFAWLNP
jgi:tryptophan-rich sensory protein